MSLIASWVAFPLLLAAIGLGWGVIVERLAGIRVADALVLPLGLAAAIVVAGTFTTFPGIASAAVPVVAAGAGVGLVLLVLAGRRAAPAARASAVEVGGAGSRWRLPDGWATVAALGALLAYGAPVLLTGEATFTGYVKLDDTATWFNIVDIVMAHSQSLSALSGGFHPPSTFTQVFIGDVGEHYPVGAFMLLGVGRSLTSIDPAWIIQPYMAFCAAALALVIYALVSPLVAVRWLRAIVAFIASQAALLYGYSLWGGIKEMTAAFLLALGVALIAPLLRRPPTRLGDLRAMLPIAVAAGAFMQTLQVGAAAWIFPAALILALSWLVPWFRRERRASERRAREGLAHWDTKPLLVSIGVLVGLVCLTAAFILPVWAYLGSFLSQGITGLRSEGLSTRGELYGNLIQPLSGWQLFGIWPLGDFRLTAPLIPTGLFIAVAIPAVALCLLLGALRRQFGLVLYVAVTLIGCVIVYAGGATPWAMGKSLSLSAPALLAAALAGAAILWAQRMPALPPIAGGAQTGAQMSPAPIEPPRPGTERPHGERDPWAWLPRGSWVLGPLVIAALGVGVLWSNVLAYSDTTIAPRDRMVELQRIGELVKGKGPTFVNEYEVYADRHFLREGAPVEPAEYRPVTVPLASGAVLTKSAWANLNAFPLSTLLPYRSIVTRRDPSESRPPSLWQLVWQGRYYQLWQRPAVVPHAIIEHVPYGEPNKHPYCGAAENSATEPLCAINPVSIPSCPQLHRIATRAEHQNAHLVAYQRAEPDFARGDELAWPAAWLRQPESHTITPTTPGTAVQHIAVPTSQTYELFLSGSFGRGFEVKVDGRKVGTVSNQLTGFLTNQPVTRLYLARGVHRFEYVYPHAGVGPASGETVGIPKEDESIERFTALAAVMLQPLDFPASELISVSPAEVGTLCGRPLEWVEIVSNA